MMPRLVAVLSGLLCATNALRPQTRHQFLQNVVKGAALLPAAQALADQLASGPTAALAATKMLMQSAATTEFATHLELEARTQKFCATSPDYTEGVQAFLDKRAPRFTGQ